MRAGCVATEESVLREGYAIISIAVESDSMLADYVVQGEHVDGKQGQPKNQPLRDR